MSFVDNHNFSLFKNLSEMLGQMRGGEEGAPLSLPTRCFHSGISRHGGRAREDLLLAPCPPGQPHSWGSSDFFMTCLWSAWRCLLTLCNELPSFSQNIIPRSEDPKKTWLGVPPISWKHFKMSSSCYKKSFRILKVMQRAQMLQLMLVASPALVSLLGFNCFLLWYKSTYQSHSIVHLRNEL